MFSFVIRYFRLVPFKLHSLFFVRRNKSTFRLIASSVGSNHWNKYKHYNRWIARDFQIITHLPLEKKSQHILDIGCGVGYLCFILKKLGHYPSGLDLSDPLFDQTMIIFDIPKIVHKILPFKRLPIDSKYDLILSSGALYDFNYHEVGEPQAFWSTSMWIFFFEDILSHLTDQGFFYLRVSRGMKSWPLFYSPLLLNAFSCYRVCEGEYLISSEDLKNLVKFLNCSSLSDEQRLMIFKNS